MTDIFLCQVQDWSYHTTVSIPAMTKAQSLGANVNL